MSAQARFFLDSIGFVFGTDRGFCGECLCPPRAAPIEAQDSRPGAPLNRGTAHTAWMRRNGLAGLFRVTVSRRGAPGGAVDSHAPSKWAGLDAYNSNYNLKSGILCGGR